MPAYQAYCSSLPVCCFRLRPRRSVRTAMAKEINMYATVQKDEMGLDKAVEDVKYMMSRYSVT